MMEENLSEAESSLPAEGLWDAPKKPDSSPNRENLKAQDFKPNRYLYIAAGFLRQGIVTFDPDRYDQIVYDEKKSLEIRPLGSSQKALSKREQYQITDTAREWIKEARTSQDRPIQIVVPESFLKTEGMDSVISLLKSHSGLDLKVFSFQEECRQSFLGLKAQISNMRPNARLIFLNLADLGTGMVIGDNLRLEKILNLDLGIQQVSDTIYNLRKSRQIESLPLFVKANLFRFIEQARLYGKPQIVGLSENLSRILVRIVGQIPSNNRISTDSIQQIGQRILESDFQYLAQNNFVESEAQEYASASLILLSYLLEGLGAPSCLLSLNSHLYGYHLNELMTEGVQIDVYYEHYFDWKKCAQELLLRFRPEDLSRSFQLANIGEKLYDSMRGKLHDWGETEKRLLWLSCFFCIPLYDSSKEVAGEMLSRIYGVHKREIDLIICIISLSSMNGLTGQSRFLDGVDPNDRGLARKLGSLVQLAKGLDITGRSVISSISLEGSPTHKLTLKILSRLDPAPELIQVQILKKNLENQFDQCLDLVVDKI